MKIDLTAPKPKSLKAQKAEESPSTVLLWGAPGSGKTRTIAELLMRGEYIFMLHCGIGHTGVRTIKEYLRTRVSSEKTVSSILDERFRHVKVQEALSFAGLAEQGQEWLKKTINNDEFFTRLSVIAVEEFNTLQSKYEQYLVPNPEGIPRQTLTRKSSAVSDSDSYGHYANIKMATEFLVSKTLELPYKHVWTAHENSNIKALSDSGDLGPWIQTRAVIAFVAAFPFSIRTRKQKAIAKKDDEKYFYTFKGSPFMKAQIENCPNEIKADPKELWRMIDGQIQEARNL